jgi:hypothetical protein
MNRPLLYNKFNVGSYECKDQHKHETLLPSLPEVAAWDNSGVLSYIREWHQAIGGGHLS